VSVRLDVVRDGAPIATVTEPVSGRRAAGR
jgi:hypothetical protein